MMLQLIIEAFLAIQVHIYCKLNHFPYTNHSNADSSICTALPHVICTVVVNVLFQYLINWVLIYCCCIVTDIFLQMFETCECHAFTESCLADSLSNEHSYSSSQHLLRQTVHKCPLCGRLAMSLKLLINHLAKHGQQSAPQSQSGHYRCTVCGKEFLCAAMLMSHSRIVHRGCFYFFLVSLSQQYWMCVAYIQYLLVILYVRSVPSRLSHIVLNT